MCLSIAACCLSPLCKHVRLNKRHSLNILSAGLRKPNTDSVALMLLVTEISGLHALASLLHLARQSVINRLADCRNGTAQDSLQKLRLILKLCSNLGIHTSPAKLGKLCIVPLLSWHHSSWDMEPDIQGVPHVSALSIADYGACSWPADGPGTATLCSKHICRPPASSS